MKHLLTIFAITLLALTRVSAQSIDALWKQFQKAQSADQPRTAIACLQKIEDKSVKEKQYGHLIVALFTELDCQQDISNDSVAPMLRRMTLRDSILADEDRVASLMYRVAMHYKSTVAYDASEFKDPLEGYRSGNNSHGRKSLVAELLADNSMLGALTAKDGALKYLPLVVKGKDSQYFNNDIISVIAFVFGDYEPLVAYYSAKGERKAACIASSRMIREDNGKASIAQIDSLISLYSDLQECGALAVDKYRKLDATEKNIGKRIAWIDEALGRWGSWLEMNELRNGREALTRPEVEVLFEQTARPSIESKVYFIRVRNLSSVNLKITPFVKSLPRKLLPDFEENEKKIFSYLQKDKSVTVSHQFAEHEDYECFRDSVSLDKLPIGVYLVECNSSDKSMKSRRSILYVSDLKVMAIQQGQNQIRYVVVNATTGRPVPGATLHLYQSGGKETTCTVDGKGEYVLDYSQRITHGYATTADDYAMKDASLWTQYSKYSKNQNTLVRHKLFTDRGIYRPGQTVHVAVLTYNQIHQDDTSVAPSQTVKITLRDANRKEIADTTLTTDEYGVGSADFTLPAKTLNGIFTVRTDKASTSVRVEEYVRPTFDVTVTRPETDYKAGDTIKVVGTAKTYSGVPVSGGRVVYTVKRSSAWWWRVNSISDQTDKPLITDTVQTDAAGNFIMRMPMIMPEGKSTSAEERRYWWCCPPAFFNIVAEATVTDIAGESHSASLSLPVGNRTSILTSDLKDKVLGDSAVSVRFTRRNQAGTVIAGKISVSLDGQSSAVVNANDVYTIPSDLASGRHTLKAICEQDTLEQSFIVFYMKDERPVIKTDDWWYQSSDRFPVEEGKGVDVQFGTSARNAYAVYSLFSGDKLIESGSLDMDSSLVHRQFKYREEYGDGICFTVAWVRDGKTYSHTAAITRSLPDKTLNLKWTTFRNRLLPGQKEEWQLSVTDKNGKPAKANVLATLYDKSLDEIKSFAWSFRDPRSVYQPSYSWISTGFGNTAFWMRADYKRLPTSNLEFSSISLQYMTTSANYRTWRRLTGKVGDSRAYMAAPRMVNSVMASKSNSEVAIGFANVAEDGGDLMEEVRVKGMAAADEAASEQEQSEAASIRENLSETAFFLPQVHTDASGIANLSFTLPESVTTWKFMAFANDKDMRNGIMTDEAVAQKQLMIQPRMPRFLREGDIAEIPATVSNLSDKKIGARATLTLIDAETEKVVYTYSCNVNIDAGETSAALFPYDSKGQDGRVLIARFTVAGQGFSDGEQHYLPVLSAKELVLATRTMILRHQGKASVDVASMLPASASAVRLTTEYTDSPEWLVIQTLPYIMEADDDNAISLASAYYANSLASSIAASNPEIEQVIKDWSKDGDALQSAIDKNSDLRLTLQNETPWICDAEKETAQKNRLYRLFDKNALSYRTKDMIDRLKSLQNSDGSWSWWKGMAGSRYMTTWVMEALLRINNMIGKQKETSSIIARGWKFLDSEMADDIKEMRKDKQKYISNFAFNYLYCRAISGNKASGSAQSNIDYLMKCLAEETRFDNMETKAWASIILAANGKKKEAREFVESIRQHTVYREDMGRYFDSERAGYSWRNYRIPTQVAVIEALRKVQPEDTLTVSEMQRWLLQSKRTQAWDTPVNTIDAIYAFFGNKTDLRKGAPAAVTIDGKPARLMIYTPALGYEKTSQNISKNVGKVSFNKQSNGESWANVFIQYTQPVKDIAASSTGLVIERKMSIADPKVGDKVTVTLTITADRDYDFVTVTDHRPACFEPANQLSGYRDGCYQVMRDSQSQYHYDKLRKGKHVITTDYYVSRAGTFAAGTANVQCAYAPEFTAHTAGTTVKVTR